MAFHDEFPGVGCDSIPIGDTLATQLPISRSSASLQPVHRGCRLRALFFSRATIHEDGRKGEGKEALPRRGPVPSENEGFGLSFQPALAGLPPHEVYSTGVFENGGERRRLCRQRHPSGRVVVPAFPHRPAALSRGHPGRSEPVVTLVTTGLSTDANSSPGPGTAHAQ